jgi:hypothetical protein
MADKWQTKYWIVSNNRSVELCYTEETARQYYEQCEKSYDKAEQTNLKILVVDFNNCPELPMTPNRDNQIVGFISSMLSDIPMKYRDGYKINHLKTGWTINYKSYEMIPEICGETRKSIATIIFNRCLWEIHNKYPDVLFRVRVNKKPYCVMKPEK